MSPSQVLALLQDHNAQGLSNVDVPVVSPSEVDVECLRHEYPRVAFSKLHIFDERTRILGRAQGLTFV